MSEAHNEAPEVLTEFVTTQNLEDAFSEKQQVESSGSFETTDAEQPSEIEEGAEKKEEEDSFSTKFAALSRKEKAIRQREVQLEQKFQALEERLAAAERRSQPVEPAAPAEEPLDQLLRKNPLEALKKFGWDYEKLTQMSLDDGRMPADMQMQLMQDELERKYQSELAELRNEITQDKEQRENEKYQQVINNFMTELNDFVDTNNESYEFIKANDAVDLVYEVIEEHYEESGRVLDKAEAADLVEQYLEEEFRQKIAKTSKAKKFLAPQEVNEPVLEKRQSSPTLSNAHAATASPKAERKLSEDESRSKAASLLKWTE